ncbi:MAG: hypothetical protein HC849_04885 [Oscillatoriales cyanobacterium RU_3_3]|nr:hypothetical protein [Oscillatoriales cyanobacterium RU_3_3]
MKPVSDQQNTAEFDAKPSKNHPTAIRNRKRLLSDRSLLVGLSCLASLGMLSKGIVWAQAETPAAELTVPAEPEPVFELTPPCQPGTAPSRSSSTPGARTGDLRRTAC